jgi:MFS transporter, UMF1 family
MGTFLPLQKEREFVNAADSTVASPPAARVAWWRVLSWQMYDFADTIYSMNVYTIYFGWYLASAFGLTSTSFGWALTIANVLVAFSSPLLGAMSDASQRRLPFLRFFAVATAVTTALIGFSNSYVWAVALFALSYFAYNSAGNFYQALLPGLCNEKNVSRVSGIGVGLGYVGSIFGVVIMLLLIKGPEQYRLAFPISAALFFLIALPCLTLVPDFAPATRKVKLDLGAAYRRVADTLSHARSFPGLFRFLVADFIYENAIAAVIGFMAVYSKTVVGFTDGDVQMFLIFSTVFAVIMGFAFGPLVDKIGPKKSVLITLGIWLVTLPLVSMVSTPGQLRLLGPLAGIGLAAVWVSSRTFLVALAPVAKSGEFFGLYSLSGKAAGVVGVAVWTLVLQVLVGRIGEVGALRSAVWVMWLFIIVGLFLVAGLPNVRPSRANILDRSQAQE